MSQRRSTPSALGVSAEIGRRAAKGGGLRGTGVILEASSRTVADARQAGVQTV